MEILWRSVTQGYTERGGEISGAFLNIQFVVLYTANSLSLCQTDLTFTQATRLFFNNAIIRRCHDDAILDTFKY